MLDVDRIGSRSDAYVKYRSLDRKTYMTMGEAEALSHDMAIEILSVNKQPSGGDCKRGIAADKGRGGGTSGSHFKWCMSVVGVAGTSRRRLTF